MESLRFGLTERLDEIAGRNFEPPKAGPKSEGQRAGCPEQHDLRSAVRVRRLERVTQVAVGRVSDRRGSDTAGRLV